MKQRFVFVDKIHNKTTVTMIEVRDYEHFLAQKNNKAKVFKPKKGPGSYTRKGRRKNIEED